jgi:hydrogenase expression/formation protein HypC
MCLAIPGRVVERVDGDARFAVVEVLKVRRVINVDLLADEPLAPGDWVLIHVGFAMTRISEDAAEDQLRIIAMLGEDEQAMQEVRGYGFDSGRAP